MGVSPAPGASPGTRGHGPKAPRPAALVPACCWAVGVRLLCSGREEHPEGRSHAPPATRGTPPLRGGTEPCPGKKPWPPLSAHTPCRGCSGTWAAPALSAPGQHAASWTREDVHDANRPTLPARRSSERTRSPQRVIRTRGSNRDEGEAGQPGAATACAFFCGALLCSLTTFKS